MSKRFIDADALMKELQEEIDFETPMYTEEQNKYFTGGLRCAIRDVKEQPTADVVEVVRCKYCKWWTKQIDSKQGRCALSGNYPTDYWYCANGERRAEK